jgi:hypothetical protein
MTDDAIYAAEKYNYDNGRAMQAYRSLEDAKAFIEDEVEQEPRLTDTEWQEHQRKDAWSLLVNRGPGEVAGVIKEFPVGEDFDKVFSGFKPGIWSISPRGEMVPLATEGGGGDRELLREVVEERTTLQVIDGD